MKNGYELLDSGNGRKLERFGDVVLERPCAQAVWAPQDSNLWKSADARFDRIGGHNWEGRDRLSKAWNVEIGGVVMKLSATDFGHLGVFPETRELWKWIRTSLKTVKEKKGREPTFLNLFAYSGGATLAAAQAVGDAGIPFPEHGRIGNNHIIRRQFFGMPDNKIFQMG